MTYLRIFLQSFIVPSAHSTFAKSWNILLKIGNNNSNSTWRKALINSQLIFHGTIPKYKTRTVTNWVWNCIYLSPKNISPGEICVPIASWQSFCAKVRRQRWGKQKEEHKSKVWSMNLIEKRREEKNTKAPSLQRVLLLV